MPAHSVHEELLTRLTSPAASWLLEAWNSQVESRGSNGFSVGVAAADMDSCRAGASPVLGTDWPYKTMVTFFFFFN